MTTTTAVTTATTMALTMATTTAASDYGNDYGSDYGNDYGNDYDYGSGINISGVSAYTTVYSAARTPCGFEGDSDIIAVTCPA